MASGPPAWTCSTRMTAAMIPAATRAPSSRGARSGRRERSIASPHRAKVAAASAATRAPVAPEASSTALITSEGRTPTARCTRPRVDSGSSSEGSRSAAASSATEFSLPSVPIPAGTYPEAGAGSTPAIWNRATTHVIATPAAAQATRRSFCRSSRAMAVTPITTSHQSADQSSARATRCGEAAWPSAEAWTRSMVAPAATRPRGSPTVGRPRATARAASASQAAAPHAHIRYFAGS